MRLSILMPSHRDNPMAISRIAQACSWTWPDVEIVVRDNSGRPGKRSVIERFQGENCRIVFVDECDSKTNFLEALALARGDFVFFVSDDDLCFDRGIAAIAQAAVKSAEDDSVAGITGFYALEEDKGSGIIQYADMESPDVVKRVFGYLGYQGPNLLFYSPIRRQVLSRCWKFLESHPFAFPFHDQILTLLYLLSGRFIDIRRLMMVYDNTNWETVNKAQDTDLKIYSASGMDPAIVRLHWLLCAFEGAKLVLNSDYGQTYTLEQRQVLANAWFKVMFNRFAGDNRGSYGSSLGPQAKALGEKWRQSFPNFALDDLLADICSFMGLFSPGKAQLYRDFWQAVSRGPKTDPAS